MYIITQAHWMHLKRALWPPSPPPKKKEKQKCNPAAIGHKRFYEMLYIFHAMPKWMFVF
jgi:hypothetical protein